jgi:hypothetical protein
VPSPSGPAGGRQRRQSILAAGRTGLHRTGDSLGLLLWLSMPFGHLIRVCKHHSGAATAFYVVAVPQGERAVNVLREVLSRPDEEYKDLGRINDTLVAALGLMPGEFARII